jgi:hypothetical protein
MMTRTRREKFTEVYQKNVWKGTESVSGTGSDLEQTARLRDVLPALMRELGAASIVDAPCGDMHWMKDVPWAELGGAYTGVDIVAELVEGLRVKFPGKRFECVDLVTEILPRADVVFCRDCLVHLPIEEVKTVLANVKRSGALWLVTTTFPVSGVNSEVRWSGWRPLNLEAAPFSLPGPFKLINEGCTEDGGKYADKSLGVWRVSDLAKMQNIHEHQERSMGYNAG